MEERIETRFAIVDFALAAQGKTTYLQLLILQAALCLPMYFTITTPMITVIDITNIVIVLIIIVVMVMGVVTVTGIHTCIFKLYDKVIVQKRPDIFRRGINM